MYIFAIQKSFEHINNIIYRTRYSWIYRNIYLYDIIYYKIFIILLILIIYLNIYKLLFKNVVLRQYITEHNEPERQLNNGIKLIISAFEI